MSHPEMRGSYETTARKAARRRWAEAGHASKKMRAYLQSQANPFHDLAVRQKSIEANARRGYRHLNGGNGRGPTAAQQTLHDLTGWPMEATVSTGQRGGGLPTHYKLDLSHPVAKIAVEVDGQSHKSKATREADGRKTAFLESRDWVVMRFKNEEVEADAEMLAQKMLNAAEARRSTTSKPIT